MVKCPHLHRADFPKYGTHVAVPLLKDNGNFRLGEQDLNNLILCLKKALKFLTSNIGSLNMRPRWSGEPLFITTAFTIKSGNIAKKNGKRVVLKKSSTRSLSNAKLVTIKGQKYYQIGKTYYKVSGRNLWIPASKLNIR